LQVQEDGRGEGRIFAGDGRVWTEPFIGKLFKGPSEVQWWWRRMN
jgi:hypothetical protein